MPLAVSAHTWTVLGICSAFLIGMALVICLAVSDDPPDNGMYHESDGRVQDGDRGEEDEPPELARRNVQLAA